MRYIYKILVKPCHDIYDGEKNMKYFNFVALLTQQYSCFVKWWLVTNEYFEPL